VLTNLHLPLNNSTFDNVFLSWRSSPGAGGGDSPPVTLAKLLTVFGPTAAQALGNIYVMTPTAGGSVYRSGPGPAPTALPRSLDSNTTICVWRVDYAEGGRMRNLVTVSPTAPCDSFRTPSRSRFTGHWLRHMGGRW